MVHACDHTKCIETRPNPRFRPVLSQERTKNRFAWPHANECILVHKFRSKKCCRPPEAPRWPFSGSPCKPRILSPETLKSEVIVCIMSFFQQMRDKKFCSRNPIGIPVSELGSVTNKSILLMGVQWNLHREEVDGIRPVGPFVSPGPTAIQADRCHFRI